MEKKCLILSAMYSLVFGSTLIGQTSYIMRGDTSASVINNGTDSYIAVVAPNLTLTIDEALTNKRFYFDGSNINSFTVDFIKDEQGVFPIYSVQFLPTFRNYANGTDNKIGPTSITLKGDGIFMIFGDNSSVPGAVFGSVFSSSGTLEQASYDASELVGNFAIMKGGISVYGGVSVSLNNVAHYDINSDINIIGKAAGAGTSLTNVVWGDPLTDSDPKTSLVISNYSTIEETSSGNVYSAFLPNINLEGNATANITTKEEINNFAGKKITTSDTSDITLNMSNATQNVSGGSLIANDSSSINLLVEQNLTLESVIIDKNAKVILSGADTNINSITFNGDGGKFTINSVMQLNAGEIKSTGDAAIGIIELNGNFFSFSKYIETDDFMLFIEDFEEGLVRFTADIDLLSKDENGVLTYIKASDGAGHLQDLFVMSDGTLTMNIIPEAADYAAISGLISLGFLLYRRKK